MVSWWAVLDSEAVIELMVERCGVREVGSGLQGRCLGRAAGVAVCLVCLGPAGWGSLERRRVEGAGGCGEVQQIQAGALEDLWVENRALVEWGTGSGAGSLCMRAGHWV